MKLLQLILAFSLLASTFIFAQNSKTNKDYSIRAPANMKDSDWQGIYTGITSCANCAGLKTTLELRKGNKYILSIKAIDKKDEPFVKKGTFKWEGNIIHLQGLESEPTASLYKLSALEARQLFYFDNKIQGEQWTDYTLKKLSVIDAKSK